MATRSAITQLRRRLQDEDNDTGPLIQNDFYLALWLNLKHWDVDKTEAAIREGLTWWRANAFPLMQQTFPPALANKLPIFLDGISKDGYPICYLRLTSMDLPALWKEYRTEAVPYGLQKIVTGLPMALELNRLRYEQLGDEALKSTRGYAIVVDAYGFTRSHLPPTPMKAASLFLQGAREAIKCPSTARTAYIIGVNKWIVLLFKPLIPVVSALGVNIKIYSTDEDMWEEDLYKIIDRKTLEEFRARASKIEKENIN